MNYRINEDSDIPAYLQLYQLLRDDIVRGTYPFAIYRERLGFYSCPVPVFDQYVLAELIHNGDFESHVNRIRRKKRKELNK